MNGVLVNVDYARPHLPAPPQRHWQEMLGGHRVARRHADEFEAERSQTPESEPGTMEVKRGAALFDVRVKRMYEKELCPDRARRSLVSIVVAHARPPTAKGNSDGTTAERKLRGGHCGVQGFP